TRMPSTRPETADLTSTLISGSTTPTSRTLTCRSSAWTLPRRNGDSFSSGLFLVVARATTMPPATRITTAMAITFFLLRMRIPFSLTMSGSDRLRPTLATVVCFPPTLLTREGGKRLRGAGRFLAQGLRAGLGGRAAAAPPGHQCPGYRENEKPPEGGSVGFSRSLNLRSRIHPASSHGSLGIDAQARRRARRYTLRQTRLPQPFHEGRLPKVLAAKPAQLFLDH